MMKQLLFELRKISLSKLTVVIVLVLLLVTGGLAYNQASKAPESQQTRQYEKKISAVISNAKRQYQQSLYNSEDSYATIYFEDVIEIYTDLKDLELAQQPVSGWDTYLSFNAANPLLLICAVFLAVQLFSVDGKTGMQPILYATADGRLKYILSKICAMLLCAFALNVLFAGISMCGMLLGARAAETPYAFVGLGEYVQSFFAFIAAPYSLRVWQAVLLLFAVRTCMTVAVCALVGFMTYALGNRLVALVLSVLIYVLNIVVNDRTYLNTDVFFDHCNLVAASDATTFLAKYQCVRVLGKPVPVLLAIFVLCAVLSLAFMGLTVLLHLYLARFRFNAKERRKAGKHASAGAGSVLLGWELKKILKNRFVVLTVALLLVASAASAVVHYKEYTSKSDQIYYDYVQDLAPLNDAQRWEYLNAEAERISQAYKNYFAYREAMSSMQGFEGDVVWIENEYYYACLHEQPLARVAEACAYQSERGLDGLTLLYDTGWMTLFESGDSILLFLAILMIATFLASAEYSSGFSGILPTTPRGRRETQRAKLQFCLISTTVLFAAFTAMQLLPIILAYRFEDTGATLVSLQTYQNAAPGLTLWQYAVLIVLVRYIVCMLVSVLACCLTGVIKVSYLSLMLLTVVIQLPKLLYDMGVGVLHYCRLTALLDGNELMLMFMDGGAFGASMLTLTFVALLATFLVINIRKNKETV